MSIARWAVLVCTVFGTFGCSSDDASPAADGGWSSHPDGSTPHDGGGTSAQDANIPVLDDLDNGLPACGLEELKATTRAANLLLVIDESGSMVDVPKGFDTNKWVALKTALKQVLANVQDDLALGLELFPHSAGAEPIALDCTDNCCEMPTAPGITVEVAEGKIAVPKIEKALDATSPAGGTPTALALSRALEYYTTGAGKDLKGDKYVLLATDGGPNCNEKLSCAADSCTTNLDGDCSIPNANCCDPMFGAEIAKARCLDDDATLAQIEKLADAHIQTFVVGIPGSETYASSLDAFAEAGGRTNPAAPPKYYAVSASGGAAGLANVLDLVTKSVITTCRLQLDKQPPNPNEINVFVDDKLVKQAGADGWMLDTTGSPPSIVLQGATCKKVQTQGAKSVRILLGCQTVE